MLEDVRKTRKLLLVNHVIKSFPSQSAAAEERQQTSIARLSGTKNRRATAEDNTITNFRNVSRMVSYDVSPKT